MDVAMIKLEQEYRSLASNNQVNDADKYEIIEQTQKICTIINDRM